MSSPRVLNGFNPGKCNVRIRIERKIAVKKPGGYADERWADVGAAGDEILTRRAMWINMHGKESLSMDTQLLSRDPAQLRMRYVDGVNSACVVERLSDGAVFEITSVDNYRGYGGYMELLVVRKTGGS